MDSDGGAPEVLPTVLLNGGSGIGETDLRSVGAGSGQKPVAGFLRKVLENLKLPLEETQRLRMEGPVRRAFSRGPPLKLSHFIAEAGKKRRLIRGGVFLVERSRGLEPTGEYGRGIGQ